MMIKRCCISILHRPYATYIHTYLRQYDDCDDDVNGDFGRERQFKYILNCSKKWKKERKQKQQPIAS